MFFGSSRTHYGMMWLCLVSWQTLQKDWWLSFRCGLECLARDLLMGFACPDLSVEKTVLLLTHSICFGVRWVLMIIDHQTVGRMNVTFCKCWIFSCARPFLFGAVMKRQEEEKNEKERIRKENIIRRLEEELCSDVSPVMCECAYAQWETLLFWVRGLLIICDVLKRDVNIGVCLKTAQQTVYLPSSRGWNGGVVRVTQQKAVGNRSGARAAFLK